MPAEIEGPMSLHGDPATDAAWWQAAAGSVVAAVTIFVGVMKTGGFVRRVGEIDKRGERLRKEFDDHKNEFSSHIEKNQIAYEALSTSQRNGNSQLKEELVELKMTIASLLTVSQFEISMIKFVDAVREINRHQGRPD